MKTRPISLFLLQCLSLLALLSLINVNQAQAFKVDKEWKIYLEDEYDQLWQEADSLYRAQLPKSALEVVNQIYDKAKRENEHGHLVKAVIYRLKYVVYVEENDLVTSLNDLRKEAETAKFPIKPVLHSMMGEIYWQYYQTNRWRFANRTATIDFKQEDIETWDLRKITEETMRQYQLSLENATALQNVKVDIYDEIITQGTSKERDFRPTLYDFLAHRAINFFQSSEPDLTKPAYQFTINQENFLSDAEGFVELNITTPDSLAYKFYMLRILQDLTRFHLNDDNTDALVDVDIKRLLFVYENMTLENKDDLLLKALKKLEAKSIKSEMSTLVTHQIARLITKQGDTYQPLRGDKNKWQYKEAIEIAEKGIARFPKSSGAIACQNLINTIKRQDIRIEMEEVNLPNKPFLTYVRYKNVQKLYWKVIKTNLNEIRQFYQKSSRKPNYQAEELKRYLAKTAIHEWSTKLPEDGDYQYHSLEAKIPALPLGKYIVLVSPDPEFSTQNNAIAYDYTDISTIAYIHRNNQPEGSTSFYLRHRETGEALAKVEAQVWFQIYNYRKGEYEIVDGGKYRSDQEGFLNIPYQNQEKRRRFYVDFTYGSDQLSTRGVSDYHYNTQFSNYRSNYKKPKSIRTTFFLDRKIYRPGQTIYFKGLVLDTDGETHNIKPDYTTTVYLYDVNSQKVGEMKVTTNAYGTFQGKFTAPSSGLTGQMRINTIGGSTNFSVEEYKRPKFEVKFEPIKGTFELNEEITAVGQAKAFSGANIDGAMVKYRVVRRAKFPRWYYYWYGGGDNSPEMEITNGATETDENGQFKVKFKAIPDPNISPSSSPIFTYTIYADVTDRNGETRSGSNNVSVGYQSLIVSVDMPDNLDKNQEKSKFKIISTNLGGEFVAAQGDITIYQLEAPEIAFRERRWQQPDKFLYTEAEFRKDFPKDLYKNENSYYQWEKVKKVRQTIFDTGTEKMFSIPNLSQWTPGKYVLEIKSYDKKGKEVKELLYFTVYDLKSKKIALPKVKHFQMLKAVGEPGEEIKLLVGTSEKNLKVLYEIEHKGKIIEKKWLNLRQEQQLLSIPIKEVYRGNFGLHYTFIKDNRLYQESQTLLVPWTNKELNISFETFRNKLYPGQEEEWKLKISGTKGDKVAAEMLATLYDASLDVFRTNSFNFDIYPSTYTRLSWSSSNAFNYGAYSLYQNKWNQQSTRIPYKRYDALNWFGYSYSNMYYNFKYREYDDEEELEEIVVTGTAERRMKRKAKKTSAPPPKAAERMEVADEEAPAEEPTTEEDVVAEPTKVEEDLSNVKVRTNFNETAFFFPELQTDSEGNIIVKFTIPEALTRWKMLGFAHTKDLKFGLIQNELVTQKDLMVVPNAPRFFRENDQMAFPSKITNLSEEDLEGTAQLMLFDALTMKPIDKELGNLTAQQKFTVKAGQSTALTWNISIPTGMQAITYRVVAKAGDFSDGEEMTLPVLTNSMLVTETMPLPIRSNQTKTFELEKLTASKKSSTLRNHKLTLEFTSNPAWYAVQALPYLMEFPHECAEQTFSRYYSNVLASHIANSSPKIKEVFEAWKNLQPDALLSNLEKNQELKSLVISETPWLLQAKDESERKRRLGVLFDLNRMANEMDKALNKLLKKQRSSGGWSWFEGMKEDRYITQHIVTGMGHLDHLGIKSIRQNSKAWNMTRKAVQFLDRKMLQDYEYLKMLEKRGDIKMSEDHLSYLNVQYLYARSFFKDDFKLDKRYQEAFAYFFGQAKKYWISRSIYMQGMIALFVHRYGDKTTPQNIVKSLRERALHSEEMGMYWKQTGGYYWYQAPIETQSLLVEVFDEVADDTKAVDDLKTWLLKQKQTQDWKTTKATAEACYALMLRGSNWLANEALVEITIGTKTINPASEDSPIEVEKGTGYFKTSWDKEEISADMGKVTVAKKDEGVAWGALYWQYFEQLDKITPAETPLQLKKQLFIEKDSDKGKILTPIKEGTKLKVGDLVKVRIELRVDRLMEYVHMKDMRASGFEPINVLSQYKWQDGLGYYESTKDAATHFFFGRLPKGTFVFEYPLRVTHEGDFSNGITSIQCMYAPEFASHSEGVRVKVVEK